MRNFRYIMTTPQRAAVLIALLVLSVAVLLGGIVTTEILYPYNAIATIYSANKIYSLSSGALTMGTVLLDDATGTTPGVWVDVHGFKDKTIHVSGVTTATLQVYGSNTPLIPANATDHIQLGSNITADSIVSITTPVRWMKVKVAAHTTGTIDAYFFGQGY